MLTRRDFIKLLAVISGNVLLPPLNKLMRWLDLKDVSWGPPETLLPQTSSVGEIYAGFLLLPDGAPVLSNVKHPERGMPTFCGVGAGRGGPVPTAVIRSFSTAAEVAREVDFPIYTFSKLPDRLRPAGAKLIRHETGEVFAVVVDFQPHNGRSGDWETTVSIWAQPEFPRPFPLWSSDTVKRGCYALRLCLCTDHGAKLEPGYILQ